MNKFYEAMHIKNTDYLCQTLATQLAICDILVSLLFCEKYIVHYYILHI